MLRAPVGVGRREGLAMSSTTMISPRDTRAIAGCAGDSCFGRPLLVTPQAEKDFEGLILVKQQKVLRALEQPLRRDKTKKLDAHGDARLWRIRVDDLRIVINARDGGEFIWRIADRKVVYRLVDNLDPRVPLSGINVEEFLMKNADKKAAPKMNGAVPSPILVSPPAEMTAGDGATLAPVAHPLLRALSVYFNEHLSGEVDAMLAVLQDRIGGFEAEILN
jgi:mRNA-degrading endonuclease RelE of RelBE toxin-antitoxin system